MYVATYFCANHSHTYAYTKVFFLILNSKMWSTFTQDFFLCQVTIIICCTYVHTFRYLLQCIKQEVLSQHGITEELLTDKSVNGETKSYVKGSYINLYYVYCYTFTNF